MPSNQLIWCADAHHDGGICGATGFMHRCLGEALAGKVERGELRETAALHIGQHVLRDHTLELFPRLKDRLWKHKGQLKPPAKGRLPDGPAQCPSHPAGRLMLLLKRNPISA